MTSFQDLGLSKPILKAISELGFETPSEIQNEAIPILLKDSYDFIGLAQTGTGKTAAFGLPLLEKIDPSRKTTQALVLAPTRELCQQIAGQLSLFSKYLGKVSVLPVYGGASIVNQIKALRRPQHIIIATPGRLLDLINRKQVDLGVIDHIILDEADEMLNMGFKEDLDSILSHTSEQKHTWLFSATFSKEIRRIVMHYMHDPVEVQINKEQEVNDNIEHRYAIMHAKNKMEALTRFIDTEPDMRALVFCRTKRETQALSEQLLKRNYKADALNGDMSQGQRDKVMTRFRNQALQLLIATDVAARGIDVNDLTHVFHYTLPDDNAYYTHRSGRTARAGKKGMSIAFIGQHDQRRVESIAKALNIIFEPIRVPDTSEIHKQRLESWCLDVLEVKSKKLPEELLERANILFGNLSKEELIAKVLTAELEQYIAGTGQDLNESFSLKSNNNRGPRKSFKHPGHKEYGKHRKKFSGRGNRKKKR